RTECAPTIHAAGNPPSRFNTPFLLQQGLSTTNTGRSMSNYMMDNEAFSGLRVIELAQWVFVPVCGALLADWGADVIRIEPPDGDPYRALSTQGIGADGGGVNLGMALANRG